MSAFGPKRTSVVAPHMSAFGGKADMTFCGCLLSRSLLGVKQTSSVAPHMSASDPSGHGPFRSVCPNRYDAPPLALGGRNETARIHLRRRGDCLVGYGTRAAK